MAYINFDPQDYFNTVLHTGTGSTASITGVGFQPDMVWSKQRNGTDNHNIIDAVRGVTKLIQTDTTTQEQTGSQSLTSFDSDGFSVGTDNAWNGSSNTYVMWNWLANGAGVSNTDGSLSSTVSVNTTSGFSIVRFTGNATAGATVGHGLGIAPDVVIAKPVQRVEDWRVYHKNVGAGYNFVLNSTGAASLNSSIWSNTAPNSTVVTLGENNSPNPTSETCILYCFAGKKGFSKFGSYIGNGNADGTFVYTGFKPAFVLFKPSSAIENWQIQDNKRPSYNPCDNIAPNNSSAEATGNDFVDLVSNGFKLRSATYSASGVTYIYMAFAENPLVNSLGNPATAG